MDKFLTLTLAGAVSGTIYSLIASGLVLTYTATGVFNLAYGGVAFTSAFLFYELDTGLGWPPPVAAAVTVLVFGPVLGLLLDVAVFRAVSRAGDAAKIMATVGLLVALPALARWLVEVMVNVFHWTIPLGNEVYVPSGIGPSPKRNWQLIDGVRFDSNQLVVVIAAALVAGSLWSFMRLTRTGLRMRALVDRPSLAALRGTNPERTSAVAWMLGTSIAALAGVVGAPVLGSLEPSTYTFGVFIATTAAVLGGLRSIPIAFAGGMVLGAAQNLVAGYATFAKDIQGFGSSVPFVFMFVGLLVLGRDRSRIAGTATSDVPPVDRGAGRPAWRRALPWLLGLVGLVAYIGFVADEFWVGLTARGLTLAVIFLSFTIVTGVGGMVSLAQTAFVTASGLVLGLCVARHDVPFLVAALIAITASVVVGVLAALPALRLGGVVLGLATLAFAFVGDRVLFQWDELRNGSSGWTIPRPQLGPLDLDVERTYAFVMLAVVGLAVVVVGNIGRSATGRAAVAVRASAAAAASSGISPTRVKLQLFAVSAALAGLGGVLLATYNRNMTAQTAPPVAGLLWIASVVLFGIRRPGAAVVAGLFTVWFPQILGGGIHGPEPIPSWLSWDGTRSPWIPSILFGLGAVQLAKDPDGILALMASQRHDRAEARRARRAARHADPVVEGAPAVAARHAPAPVARAPRGGADAALEVVGVRAGYGDVEVLHGIDLVVPRGLITAVIGPNGAGKSTLCAVLAGGHAPSSGDVLLDGVAVTHLRAHARSRRGIVLAPESRGVFPGLSVEDNLALWMRDGADHRAAYERFPILGTRRSALAGNLSGGEQQMLALAPILIRPPAVVVADEPTLGLAPQVVATVMEVFVELRDAGVTVVLVEEKAKAILQVADQIAVLELGRIAWTADRADVDEDALASAYLGGRREAAVPTPHVP